MLLHDVQEVSTQVARSPGRLEKIQLIAGCLRRAEPGSVEIAVAYLSGEVRQSRVGVGPAAVVSAMAVPACEAATLALAEVDAILERIAATSGPGSAGKRAGLLRDLFGRATGEEQRFLLRLLTGELRQGALEGVMIEAVARAAGVAASDLRRAVMLAGGLAGVTGAALTEGPGALSRFSIQLFRPLKPMLAQTAADVSDALSRLGSAAFEHKLDGARVQVHKSGGEIRVFTRLLNDATAAVPEIVERMAALPVAEIILDGEAIALRPDGRPQPFQVTMRRFGRRLDVARMRAALPMRCFFFDCLYLDGAGLIDRPAADRFAALSNALPPDLLVDRTVASDPATADAFFAEALRAGHEGVMAKALDAPYESGARGAGWLKIKRAHTLDLVVLAAEWGHGRRRGWLSNLHLGARDPVTGDFVMLGKTFKGMTDEMLAWQTQRLQEIAISSDSYTVRVRPELVVEVAFNDIQASPHYPGGLALRFARIKGYRPDKRAEDADTIEAVRAIHASQTNEESGS